MTDFYINNNRIQKYIDSYPSLRPLHENPVGEWLASKSSKGPKKTRSHVERLLKRANGGKVIFVLYEIPNRDLGSHSAGGTRTHSEYIDFIEDFCRGLGDNSPIVIFEPDALPHMLTHMNTAEKIRREQLIKKALRRLQSTNATVYLDVGHCRWISADEIAQKLKVFHPLIHGFSVNVSNYYPTNECIAYAESINSHLHDPLPYVIDTSRNGRRDFDGTWCNPPGRRLGPTPTLSVDQTNCDGFLWIKVPGESDGKCRGGPSAGVFWLEQALELCS